MVSYTCPRCGHVFYRKTHYVTHTKKKLLCESILANVTPNETNFLTNNERFSCKYCSREFAIKYDLTSHYPNCPKRDHLEDKIGKLQQELSTLKGADKHTKHVGNILTINNDNSVTINDNSVKNTLNLVINDFKDTEFDYITEQQKYNYISSCMRAVPKLIEEIHFNPKHPENHNMYISNHKQKTAKYKDNGRWLVKNGVSFIEDLIVDYHNKVFDNCVNDTDMINAYPNFNDKYEQYFKITEPQEAQKKIVDEIMEIMYNKKDMIIETNKLMNT